MRGRLTLGAAKTAATVYGRLFTEPIGVPLVSVRPILALAPLQKASKLIPHVIRLSAPNDVPPAEQRHESMRLRYGDCVVSGVSLAAGVRPVSRPDD